MTDKPRVDDGLGWTVGSVYPDAYSRAGHADDPSSLTTECLLQSDGNVELDVTVRFGHVVDRRIARVEGGMLVFVDGLAVDDAVHSSSRELVDREVRLGTIRADGDAATYCMPIVIEAGTDYEKLVRSNGQIAGMAVRSWNRIVGAVDVWTDPISAGLIAVRVDISNSSSWKREPKEKVLYHTLCGAHSVLMARGGRFVSEAGRASSSEAAVSRMARIVPSHPLSSRATVDIPSEATYGGPNARHTP